MYRLATRTLDRFPLIWRGLVIGRPTIIAEVEVHRREIRLSKVTIIGEPGRGPTGQPRVELVGCRLYSPADLAIYRAIETEIRRQDADCELFDPERKALEAETCERRAGHAAA